MQTDTFAHIGSRFRSAGAIAAGLDLAVAFGETRGVAVTATVKTRDGATVAGRVTQISDFRMTLVDAAGQKHAIEREPGVVVEVKDPLAAHEQLIMTLLPTTTCITSPRGWRA